jgi:RNA polymerase primary sigma factor
VQTKSGQNGDPLVGHIERTLAYVPVVARHFMGRGLPRDELVAAGNLGLVEAALRFDPGRNVKFITYADWWIRKAIHRALEQEGGPVRVPRYQHDRLRRLREARREWVHRHGVEPDADELGVATGLSRAEVDQLLHLLRGPVSLERPAHPADDRPLKETLVAPDSSDPQRTLARRDLANRLRHKLMTLGDRELRVITLRFGLNGEGPLTLRQAGRCLGISRERVRQLEHRTLIKLKQMI